MLITESQLNWNRSANGLALLDNMSYLTEAESVYSPALVPVVENTTVGAHLIRLEDMVSFAESNGIEDLGYALSLVCEASEVDPQTVAFSVQEDTIIADNEIATLTRDIMNEGVTVVAVPVNENHPACLSLDIAFDHLCETGDSTMLDAVAELDYDAFFEAAVEGSMVGKEALSQNKALDKAAKQGQKANAKLAKNTEGTLATIWQKLKNGVGITRDWLAKILAWLRQKAIAIEGEAKKVPAKDRGIWDKIKGAIAHAIEVVTRKMHNFIEANRGELKEIKIKADKKK